MDEPGEDRHFRTDRPIERLHQAEFDAGENRQRGGFVAQHPGQFAGAMGSDGPGIVRVGEGGAAGSVPRLDGMRGSGQQPCLGSSYFLTVLDHSIDQPGRQSLLACQIAALQQDFKAQIHPDQPRHPLGATGTWQQPDPGFGQAEHGARRIGEDAVVTAQCKLAAPAKRNPRNGRRDRLACGLEPPDCVTQGEEVMEGDIEAIGRARRDDHIVGDAQFGQVGSGTETGRLARPHHHPAHGTAMEPFGESAELVDRLVRKHVHRAIGAIEYQVDQPVVLRFDAKLGELGEAVSHAFSLNRGLRNLPASSRTGSAVRVIDRRGRERQNNVRTQRHRRLSVREWRGPLAGSPLRVRALR